MRTILFEKPDCEDCKDFHQNVLGLGEIRNTLKDFKVVRLNQDDKKTPVIAPDGTKTTPAKWFERSALSKVPALLFFNEQGEEVLKTDVLVL